MRLMRVVHVMVGAVQVVMRVVDTVMGTVDPVVGIVNGGVRIVAGYEGIRESERVRVSLVTISYGGTTAGGHVIARRSSLGCRGEFPWWRSRVQWRRRRLRRCLSDFDAGDGAVPRYSSTFPGWRLALSTVVLTRLPVVRRRRLDLYGTQR